MYCNVELRQQLCVNKMYDDDALENCTHWNSTYSEGY